MIIENLYNPSDLMALEAQVLHEIHHEPRKPSDPIWLEPVGQHLWSCWMQNRNDSRILAYMIPSLQIRLASRLKISRYPNLNPHAAFNTILVQVVAALPRYDPSRGSLFSYILMICTYRILDLAKPKLEPLVNLDATIESPLVSDEAGHQLADFIGFVKRLKLSSGHTDNRILDALLSVLAGPINCPTQKSLLAAIAHESKLPIILIQNFYFRVLEKYEHSVLD